ncbi:MAG: glycosyltransferase family 2 protein [Clostridiales bacterium]|nr:glycosyltransferase family 2 protein [Clostridiales bacterium]
MLFSIITVCLNSEKTIERTIKSVLEQSCQDYEYILVDGESTDHTLDIIHRYEPLFGGRMKVISEPDQGIYDAMNKGIRSASGELIGIVNSDDFYEKDALEKIAKAYKGYDYSILYGMLRTISDGKEVMVYIKNHEFLKEDMITHPTCFVTRKIYERFGGYSLKYPYSADYEFMLRMKQEKEVRFTEIYSIISNFSLDGVSGGTKAYRDTLRLQHEYGLIGNREYRFKMFKSWIAMKLGR